MLRDVVGKLEHQRRLAYTGVTADKHQRARDNAAPQDPVAFFKTRRKPGQRLGIAFGDRSRRGIVADARPRFLLLFEYALLDDGIPLAGLAFRVIAWLSPALDSVDDGLEP